MFRFNERGVYVVEELFYIFIYRSEETVISEEVWLSEVTNIQIDRFSLRCIDAAMRAEHSRMHSPPAWRKLLPTARTRRTAYDSFRK